MQIRIIPCSPQDAMIITSLGRKTFYESFAAQNTEEDVQQYLDTAFTEEKIGDELSDLNSKYFLATIEHEPVGYLKLNFSQSQTELQDENSLEIERIYVLKQYHGMGVGQHLIDKAITIAKEMKMGYVWLGVWEYNPRAIRFYEKQGFEKFGSHPFKLGEDLQTDILMKLILTKDLPYVIEDHKK